MKVIVISESLIIRKGVMSLINSIIYDVYESDSYTDIRKSMYDVYIVVFNKYDEKLMQEISYLKKYEDKKIIILDFYKSKVLFDKCVSLDIDAYIVDSKNGEDIKYALEKISNGKQYYDTELMKDMINYTKNVYLEELTKRENQIFQYIADGLSNNEISDKLFITKHTVKKHITHIFNKLGLDNRKQAIIYFHCKYNIAI